MIRVNGRYEDWPGESIADLVARLGIDPRGVAVALNGEVVRRAQWPSTVVGDGDVIEVVTAAAGG